MAGGRQRNSADQMRYELFYQTLGPWDCRVPIKHPRLLRFGAVGDPNAVTTARLSVGRPHDYRAISKIRTRLVVVRRAVVDVMFCLVQDLD